MLRFLIWPVLVSLAGVPIWLALNSPLLAWREPVYILAGAAGVVAFACMLFQPVLVAGWLPGMRPSTARRLHVWTGLGLVIGVIVHLVALWITSPPDVIDALLLVSPTPFSHWGVIAMWALFGAAGLAVLRRKGRLRPVVWRVGHTSCVSLAVFGTVLHALLVDGTMELVSKVALCVGVVGLTVLVIFRMRAWRLLRRRD